MILIAYNLPLIFADDFDNLLNILDAALGKAEDLELLKAD